MSVGTDGRLDAVPGAYSRPPEQCGEEDEFPFKRLWFEKGQSWLRLQGLVFLPCHLPLLLTSPELSSPLWPPRGKAAAQPPSHPAACTLTPRQLRLEVRWTLKSLSLRSPRRRQLPVNASRTSPSACWHVRSFLPPGLLGSRHTVSVRLWSVVHSFWPGGDQSASDKLFLPNLIQ